ncbi:hypothetical protein [Cellulomonas dongxiuzhuiae]|uniref:X-X-X-Leu-X-X-Gly heptad repeat-containing protein n=1 Tax=Cellulomonas dongxiuzhuiae TaxID=2819979 RepID=A0ABX8GKY4_9CELL|nr:hypothetical protein [Cellulomonas dongxiuzhuiae]MBO3089758.1 hypothetical protein [Cellulomonas dongxiuzhuiae]MBO3095387.1 hypothetical protein [Cellulomonas dongxiuzhuiae]QWC16372.1 hypothetical protein KKR89_01455 [Cellulomonas dongxiuzhuiae]
MSAPTPHRPVLRRVAGAGLGLPLALLVAAPPATAGALTAAAGDVVVTNTETVQARLDADGRLQVARVYDQLAFSGQGSSTFSNPVSTQGLRNLDGFGGSTLRDGAMEATVEVDGKKRLRTVSDFTGELPVSIAVDYLLDGKKVSAGGVVGRSGTLEVRYTVTNLTTRQDQVTYDDGTGKQATATAETVIPFVGQLTTTLPPSFTAVTSQEANMAGDGRGGTKMSYTMTLFPPIGSPTAEFGYTAQITGGRIPPANVSVLPVSPLTSPSFKGGSASYKGGAESGIALTQGATEIDGKLLKLRDGAATLLDGLLQLQAGADQLAAGLNDTAAPGAASLAAGAATVDDGAAALATGARSLGDGAGRLATGAAALDEGLTSAGSKVPELLGGLRTVDEGLATMDRGLEKMYSEIGGVPAQAQPIKDGITRLQGGVTALLDGLTTLQGLQSQLATVYGVLGSTTAVVTAATDAQQMGALHQLFTGLAQQTTEPAQQGQFQALASLYNPVSYTPAPTTPVPLAPAFAGLAGVTGSVVTRLEAARCGLSSSVSDACPLDASGEAKAPGLREGLAQASGGIDQLTAGVVDKVRTGVGVAGQTKEDGTLRGGVASLTAGVGQLSAGGQTLVGGLGQLAAGASSLRDGSAQLAGGAGQLVDGSSRLTAGTSRLTAGADQLSDGLRTAADGSLTLADGLGTAADGAPALVDGASRLSEEGTSVLVETGAATAADYGVKYAVIKAGADRAANESMAYGGPEGAASVTAYSIDIAAAEGAAASSVGRGIAAAALFGLGGVLAGFARRRLV